MISYFILAILVYMLIVQHRGFNVRVHLPEGLRHEGYVNPHHEEPLTLFLCNGQGKVKMEVSTLKLKAFPEIYDYAGVRYHKHRISKSGKSAEYRIEP